jgi:ketosteroid isomerase-like protein
MSQANVDVVREVIRAFNDRDDSAMSHYAEDVEFRLIGGFSGMAGENLRGREAIRRFAQELIDNLRARFVVERLFEAGDRVVLIASTVGAGDASGAGVEWRWGQIYSFRDGVIAAVDNYWEAQEALEAVKGTTPRDP